MALRLDHVIVRVRDLDRARADWRRLSLIVTDGGVHPHRGTRNAIVRFPDRSFVELIALHDRELMAKNAPDRLPGYESGPDGPVSWAVRTDEIEAEHARLRSLGAKVSAIEPGEGRRDSGKIARWRRFGIDEPSFPFVVSYDGAPTSEPAPDGLPIAGIARVIIEAPKHAVLSARLRALLGDVPVEVREADAPRLLGVALRSAVPLHVHELGLVP